LLADPLPTFLFSKYTYIARYYKYRAQAPVAQSVEHPAVNRVVEGSSPSGSVRGDCRKTKNKKRGKQKMKGKGFLKVTGILMIIFAAIALIVDVISLVVMDEISAGSVSSEFPENVRNVASIAVTGLIIGCAGSALEMATGIIGVANSKKPQKATICIVFGIIVLAIEVISLIFGFVGGQASAATIIVSVIVGLALPVLYLIGAILNKKSMDDVVDQFMQQAAVKSSGTNEVLNLDDIKPYCVKHGRTLSTNPDTEDTINE
jgi:hypothetical protein